MSAQISEERLEESASSLEPISIRSGSGRRVSDNSESWMTSSKDAACQHGLRRRYGRGRIVAATVAIASVAIIVVGVVSALTFAPSGDFAAATPSPDPSSSRVQNPLPEGLLATGTFISPDGSTSGRVEVHAQGTSARVVILDLQTTPH